MQETGTSPAEPIAVFSEENPLCPQCGHEHGEPRFRFGVWVAQRLGIRPPKAFCAEWQTSVESGVGLPGECGCDDSFHGS